MTRCPCFTTPCRYREKVEDTFAAFASAARDPDVTITEERRLKGVWREAVDRLHKHEGRRTDDTGEGRAQ